MKRIFVAIASVALGLFLSLSYGAVAQTGTSSPSSPTPATSAPAPVSRPATPTASPSSTALSELDRQFVRTAAEAGLANIAMGQLALQRTNNAEVRQFAQAEIAEQQQIKQNLTRLVPRMGVALPTAPGPKYQALMSQLSQLSGEQFNQAYMNEAGVNAHLENAATFQREAQFGRYPDLVNLATAALPTIQQHFTIASQATNYQFARVAQRFNRIPVGTPQSTTAPVVVPSSPQNPQ